MTAKEKALEIYHNHARRWHNTSDDIKYSAHITVEEVLNAIDWHEFEAPNKQLEFWNEVKKEIEAL
jgi:hypothetical protein